MKIRMVMQILQESKVVLEEARDWGRDSLQKELNRRRTAAQNYLTTTKCESDRSTKKMTSSSKDLLMLFKIRLMNKMKASHHLNKKKKDRNQVRAQRMIQFTKQIITFSLSLAYLVRIIMSIIQSSRRHKPIFTHVFFMF